jgi:glycine oxidase
MREARRQRAGPSGRRPVAAHVNGVLIVGGGVMGCACAWELARHGLHVRVLEKSVPGAEASSAAAGILGAQLEAAGPGPMLELSLLSRARYPRWARALKAETGIDIGFRASGLLSVAPDAASERRLAESARWQKKLGLELGVVKARALHELEPALGPKLRSALLFPREARLEPRLLLRALHIAAQRAGVEFQTGAYVRDLIVKQGRATGVSLEDGRELAARHVVVAAGSWTTLIGGLGLRPDSVRPARGQIVELSTPAPLLKRVVFGPRCYLVPRDDGRMLVGSTLEFVGYRREVTARAVRDLLDAALELVPRLAEASLGAVWSNFRPYTDDELPLIGPAPIQGLLLATGHYRNGILLAPITAEIVRVLVKQERLPLALDAFAPQRRFARA